MVNKRVSKRALSLMLSVLMLLTSVTSGFYAFAENGIIEIYEMEITYSDGTAVPDADGEGNEFVERLMESESLQLSYNLIGCNIPDGGYVRWYSESPTLVDVDSNGLVTAYDSSKGALVQLWIDNEVKSIPLIGGILGSMLESALFNDTIDIDSMDTDQIVAVVERLFGENSAYGAYTSGFVNSLKEYLNRLNCTIHVQLCAEDGTVLCEDGMKILVTKSDKWYASFLPNGTHITNKESLETTVAVDSTAQLYAITTPKRLNYGVTYSIQNTSLFNQNNVATVDENGLVSFINTGTVTIVASPDSADVSEGMRKLINSATSLIASGDLDTDSLADILINVFNVNIDKTVLTTLLNGIVRVAQFTGNSMEFFDRISGTLSTLTNSVMRYAYNDTITFTVVEPEPLVDFSITGPTSVQEGAQIQLEITDIVPSVGEIRDIVWNSSDPSIASVDENTGTVTGRDSGGSLGSLSSSNCTITATSPSSGVSKSVTVKVTGRTGNYISDAEIDGPDMVQIGENITYACNVYPTRNSSSSLLETTWGIVTGTDDSGEPVYVWATESEDASDGIGLITSAGNYTSVSGGLTTIAVKAVTGYSVGNSFYEISNVIATKDVQNDIPVNSITLSAERSGNAGTLTVTESEFDGALHKYATLKLNNITAYYNHGIKLTAHIDPETANTNVIWRVDNDSFSVSENASSHTVEVRAKASVLSAASVNIWCETADGSVKSETVTLTVTRNAAVSNIIDGDEIEGIVGKNTDVTHTVSYDGNITIGLNTSKEASWYSSDESIFTVSPGENSNAVITGVSVGTATLYCVLDEGGITASKTVTIYPDKDYLYNVIEYCDKTVILKTAENKKLYSDYMRNMDKAYNMLYDVPMAQQRDCDIAANKLLEAFVNLGGYVGIGEIVILDKNKDEFESKYVTVDVGTLSNYRNSSYDFEYRVIPEGSMYSRVIWTSSDSSISVDANGKCTPTANSACSAVITCTIEDYLGNKRSDSAYISFSRTPATGITLDKSSIENAEIGTSEKLTATVLPDGLINNASNNGVKWSSSDDSIAAVDSEGNVSFKRGGSCVITATTVDGGYTADCRISVITNFTKLINLINDYKALALESEDYYPATYAAFETAMGEAENMVSEKAASQDEVDAMYDLLAAAFNGLKKYVYLDKVEIYLDGEAVSDYYQYDLSLLSNYSNAKLNLNVRLYPNNASYESVKWESSTGFIKVNSEGVCSPTANQSGYGKITCTITDHFGTEFSDYVWVSFAKTPATGISLSDSVINGKAGNTKQLTATVKPEGGLFGIGKADIGDVMWTSDNEGVATVSDSGLVTFVSAGAANITATAYDGGYSASCLATTLGDRSVLQAALEEYKDIVFTDYEYDYGIAFKEAYSTGEASMDNIYLSQAEIDKAASDILEAATELFGHPFVKIENISLQWNGSDLTSQKISGTVGENNSIQVLSSDLARISTNARVTVTAAIAPENAMYKSVKWTALSSSNMNVTDNGNGSVTVHPAFLISVIGNAYARLKVTYTDVYEREYSTTVNVLIGDAYVTGISIDNGDYTAKGTDEPTTLSYTLTSSTGNAGDLDEKGVDWTSSDSSVASVDEHGTVTPLDEGTAVITATTLDGGYTDSITVTVTADYEKLIAAIEEYSALVSSNRGKYFYTEESLDALQLAIDDARPVAEEQTEKQAVINEKLAAIENAYASLERYIPAEGLTLSPADDETTAQEINTGFVRCTGTSLNGKTVKLKVNPIPEGSRYEKIEWSSDNSAVTVDSSGSVKSTSSASKVAKITCTITNYDNTSYTNSVYVSFVRYGVTGISFSEDTTYYGMSGESVTLSPSVTYSGSTLIYSYYVSTCKYKSSNESVAIVGDNGVVTFVSPGSAVITATTLDGGYTAETTVYTTYDTTALKNAINTSNSINYTDYEYSYGIAFKNKYEAALGVYSNYLATQEEIDLAAYELTNAKEALEGHPFIKPDQSISANGVILENGAVVRTDSDGKVTLYANIADGAMIKSFNFSASDANGVTFQKSDSKTITFTRTQETGTAKVILTVTDDYDRVYDITLNITFVEKLVPCTDLTFTANEVNIDGSSYTYSCGGSYSNIALTIGYIPIPADANMIESVSYSSSSSFVKINSSTGAVTMGTLSLLSSYSTTITCTLTNADGTTVKKTVSLTVKRN